MSTLAIDTATPFPSFALLDGAVTHERTVAASPGAGRRVVEELHRLLGEADADIASVDRIVVGVGPGGFTGLRIGIATALGLGQALDATVVGVASIEALALAIADEVPAGALLVPVIDGKRGEVFAAAYRSRSPGGLETALEPRAADVEALAVDLLRFATAADPAWLAGDGAELCAAIVDGERIRTLPRNVPAVRIRAVDLVRRAEHGGGRPATPLYLRLPDAEVNRRRRVEAAG